MALGGTPPIEATARCDFWSPPEWCAVVFRRRLIAEEIPEAVAETAAARVRDFFCQGGAPCGARLHATLKLDMWDHGRLSVGTADCPPLHDPADCVEKLFRSSFRVGFEADESRRGRADVFAVLQEGLVVIFPTAAKMLRRNGAFYRRVLKSAGTDGAREIKSTRAGTTTVSTSSP